MFETHIRIAIALLLFLFSVVYTKRQVKQEDDPLVTEETIKYLQELTNTINNCLKHPSSDNGTVLFRSLYEYYNELHGIYWTMRDKSKRDKVTNFVERIISHGLPAYLRETINFDESKDKFLWNEIIIQEVNAIIKDIKDMWENCKSLL